MESTSPVHADLLTDAALYDTDAVTKQLAVGQDAAAVFKTALKGGRQRIATMHAQKADVEAIVSATSGLIDQLLGQVWQWSLRESLGAPISLLAVGGYGRQELNINSDIDLLILSKRSLPDDLNQRVESFIQLLWDLNLEVGHSVRTLKQCLSLAQGDVTIMTNLLEARPLLADCPLHPALQESIRDQSIWPDQQFYNAKLEEQLARHARFDDTAYKLEPNLKSSPGGLRDLQTICWMANRIFGVGRLEDAAIEGLLTPWERDTLIKHRNLLWQIRNALHVLSGRNENRILFNYQNEIAAYFGFEDNDTQLAIEQLMQQYYRAAKEIRRLNEFILQQIGDRFNTAEKVVLESTDPRFVVINGHLSHRPSDLFAQDPSALLDIFTIYQRDPNVINFSAATVRAVRSHLHIIDDEFRQKPENLATFLAIFTHDKGLTHTIRKLDDYGVLGRFLPVYGRIAGQMQHDLFHAYTVDAHSLFVVRNLRRFAVPKHNDELPELSEIMQRSTQRHRLYLAGLFHDIAKGRGGNHDKLGAIDAEEYCTLLRMPPDDVQLVAWLVLNHLQMSKVSQREDLSDPAVIAAFAELVGNQTYLDNLYLLTVADIRATSPETWTAWKGHLLNQLYDKTLRWFSTAEQRRVEDSQAKAQRRKQATAKLLKGKVSEPALEQYWAMLDDDYINAHRSITIAWHAAQICSASALDMPVVDARYLEAYEAQQYLIYTADSPYVLAAITGAFDNLSQNILQAKIHAANPGFTILLFTVTTLAQSAPPQADDLDQDAQRVRAALIATHSRPAPKKHLMPRRLKQFNFQAQVQVSEVTDQGNLTIELIALDEPGLVNKISNVFAQCHVRLISANITTVGEKAEDTFVVGHPAKTESLTKQHKQALEAALNEVFDGAQS